MPGRVFVVGVGMTKFEKPGSRDWDYPDMVKIAVNRALADASLPYDVVEQAAVGYCYGDSTCGQRALYEVGMKGIPIYNVNNNCSTGSTALFMARNFIKGGLAECALAVGFEKMEKGSLGVKYQDRTNPMDKHVSAMLENHAFERGPPTAQMFGNAGREHMKKYGTKLEHFAKIAEKNHRHSANNPYSQFRDVYTLEQIMNSRKVHEPLTKLQCCPTSDGAGAAIVCSEAFVKKWGLQNTAVEIIGMSMTTDTPSTFGDSMIKTIGGDMTVSASQNVYKESGIGPEGVQVVELHDCFSANELVTYEGLGLCPVGGAGAFIDAGDNTYGGKYVVNPSGGLISKGHPLGATGLAQCAELCWQLRGQADKRQVANAKVALQHNLGLGGACVVAMYKRATDLGNGSPKYKTPVKVSQVGDAPAAEAAVEDTGMTADPSLKAGAVFAEMKKRLDAAMVKKVGCSYRFDVTGASAKASWLINLKKGDGSIMVVDADKTKADCMISISDDDFVQLMGGKLNPQQAFMAGKIKVKGNMMLAMKLQNLTATASKL